VLMTLPAESKRVLWVPIDSLSVRSWLGDSEFGVYRPRRKGILLHISGGRVGGGTHGYMLEVCAHRSTKIWQVFSEYGLCPSICRHWSELCIRKCVGAQVHPSNHSSLTLRDGGIDHHFQVARTPVEWDI
jgi:hypothetical protein